jgi:hypothetical protein
MSKAFRSILAMLFTAWNCLSATGKPQAAPVIGQVVESSGATVDGVAALSSTTLLAGDNLATPKGGGALARVAGKCSFRRTPSSASAGLQVTS